MLRDLARADWWAFGTAEREEGLPLREGAAPE